MITFLASLAIRAGVPDRFAKVAGILAAIVVLVILLMVGKCSYDRHVIANNDAAREAQAAPVIRQADAKAANARVSDLARNRSDENAERAAVAPLPDARLSDRQRQRACAILRRQAAKRGDEITTGC